MEKDVIYLFDTKRDIIKFNKNTLKLNFENNSEKNYKKALLRKKIFDFYGAILYSNKALDQNKYFTKAYNLKTIIYLELNQFDNSILNFFKSVIIDKNIYKKSNPTAFDNSIEYLKVENQKIKKFRNYIHYYKNYIKRFENYNEFAQNLIQNKKFNLLNNNFEETDYNLFMNLEEKTVC